MVATISIGDVPPVPGPGVPDSVAVPSPLSTKVRPSGRTLDSVKAGGGQPVVVTVKVPAIPTVNVTVLTLVIAGA